MSDFKVAIVTGGAQGLGAAICKTLLQNGYKVCVSDINDEQAQPFVAEQQQICNPESVIYCHCDVTKMEDYENVFEKTLAKFGRVDLLVNNAGIADEHNPKLVVEINLLGPIFGCQAAVKYMGKSNHGTGGTVVNVASIYGLISTHSTPCYSASKHGVVGLTRSYGKPYHLEKEGIIFMALCPSFADTNLLKANHSLIPDEKFFNIMKSLQDKLMSPDYVAEAVLKLLEDRKNGSTLWVTRHGYQYIELQEELKNIET